MTLSINNKQMLTEDKIDKIKTEIKQAAQTHLQAKDAKEALSHFSENIVAVSNDKLFPSFKTLADDVNEYYKILKDVHVASWDDITVQVINENTATFIAKFDIQSNTNSPSGKFSANAPKNAEISLSWK